jgi:predicted protein tyrosine phosphatase
MSIWICSLAAAPQLVRQLRPSRVVSLLSPYDTFPTFEGFSSDLHLQVPIHDIVDDVGDWRAPDLSDAESVIKFVHPWDRSTASAFITACVHNPDADEHEIAEAIRAASPTASPNRRLVAHADALLGRNGRMNHAVDSIGRGSAAMEAQAFSIPSTYAAARGS